MTVALWAAHRLPLALRPASPIAVIALALAAFVVPIADRDLAAAARDVGTPGGLLEAVRCGRHRQAGRRGQDGVRRRHRRLVRHLHRQQAADPGLDGRQRAADGVRRSWPCRPTGPGPNDGIARFLAANDRYGIPFNAVYGPGAPTGIVLPELLTEHAVLDALAKAAGG